MRQAGRRAFASLRRLGALIALMALGAAAYGQTFPVARIKDEQGCLHVLVNDIAADVTGYR
jgi:hypothetical protein